MNFSGTLSPGRTACANGAAYVASTDIERIYGMVNPRNAASLRVMEKIGMTRLGLREFRGEQDVFFMVERT